MTPIHPTLEALRLDEFQRAAAFTEETAVVTAGAGAGKTRALVGRYLFILIEKEVGPERVLALTFTRKAAAEMFQRVHQTLISPEIGRQDLAGRLARSHIQTLDSFCREIVAGAAPRYGYTADFSIDEVACVRAANKAAHRYVLANQRAPGLRELLSAFGYAAVTRDLFASFGAANVEPQWTGRRVCRESARLGELEFERTASDIAAELAEIAADILSLAQTGPEASFKEGTAQAVRAAAAFQLQAPALTALRDFLGYLQAPEHAINLRSVGKSATEQAIKELSKRLNDKKLIRKITQLLDFERFLPEYRAVMERLDEYADALCDDKRRANIMNYRDLGALAVDALERDEDFRRYWQSRFDYILIDEFQDNNELQKRLLLLLSGGSPGKLFFVGDEKQSIYLFRGADVSVFKSLAPELGAARYALAKNYRSARRLIDFFNAVFPLVMTPQDGERQRPFEAGYEPMEVGGGDFASRIEYHCVTSDRAIPEPTVENRNSSLLSTKETMAFRVARWIRSAVESSDPMLVRGEDQRPRPARYSDIAVLMRTTSRQYELEKYLRMFGIPFSTDSSASMFSEEPMSDLYFALRLALDPDDMFATAAVLRSPLCGVSDDGYAQLLADKLSLRALAGRPPEGLTEEDRARVGRMLSFYSELEGSIDHLPLMELCDRVWRQGGLEASVKADPAKAPYLEHWSAARAIAADVEAKGGQLQALLYELRAFMDRDRAFEANAVPRREFRGLRLMTIHKSKGLEFPIVILPWIEAGTNKSPGEELWGELERDEGHSDSRRFFTADIGFHDRIEGGSNVLQTHARDLQTERERAETKRLLYVACTRAIDHLIMFDAAPSRRAYDADSFRALLLRSTERWTDPPDPQKIAAQPHLSLIDFYFEPLASEGEVAAQRSVAQRRPPEALESSPPHSIRAPQRRLRLTATAFNAAALEHPSVREEARAIAAHIAVEHIFEASPTDDAGAPDAASTAFGSLVHELFAYRAAGRSIERFAPSAETALALGPEATARAQARLEPLFASPFFAGLTRRCAARGGLKLEFPFLLGLLPWTVEGRMDALADCGDELIVLDLKTDQRYVPHEYALQLALYQLAAQRLYPGKSVRAGLLYLSFGEISWLSSAPDEAALLRICDTISYNHTQH